MEQNELKEILSHFATQGNVSEIKPLGEGLINDTYLVKTAEADQPDYMRARISKNVNLSINLLDEDRGVMLCPSLFEWVMENLAKNAVDAMQGKGSLSVTVTSNADRIFIDVTDTGKGISRKNFKNVFNPGFTTKSRGWGLGLTLAKRIIEEYHGGRIYVKTSKIGVGTTFRIEIPACR